MTHTPRQRERTLAVTRVMILACAALVLPRAAWAHPGTTVTPQTALRHWEAGPAEVLLIVLPLLWYILGVRALWRRAGTGRGVSRGQAVAFCTANAVLALALLSPLDGMAEALFSAHMVQHLLLILVAAPLWVIGAPPLPFLWALPRSTRRALGGWWNRRNALRRLVHTVMEPALVFVLHMVALWFWHFPGPYQAALANPAVHALEHLSFFGTAVMFWWVVAPPLGRRRVSEGAGILIIGGTLMQSGVLGAVLMFARTPWYPAHAEGARAWGTTLLHDQQLAGLLMWVPASAVYVAAAAWLFLRWMRDDEAATNRAGGTTPLSRVMPRLEEVS